MTLRFGYLFVLIRAFRLRITEITNRDSSQSVYTVPPHAHMYNGSERSARKINLTMHSAYLNVYFLVSGCVQIWKGKRYFIYLQVAQPFPQPLGCPPHLCAQAQPLSLATCIYAIAVKIRKEKKVNISRVDENQLRYAEIEMRNVKNKYNTDCDRYKSQISLAKKKISDLKEQDLKISEEIKNLNSKISQCRDNLDFYVKQKSIAESKIDQPDPKYFSLKSDIKSIEAKIAKCDEEINELSDKLIKDLSVIKNVETCDEAMEFITSSSALLSEIEELSRKLILFSDKEKTQAGVAVKQKIAQIESRLNISNKEDIPKLSEQELLKLKETSASLREQTLEIKNQYLNIVTHSHICYKPFSKM